MKILTIPIRTSGSRLESPNCGRGFFAYKSDLSKIKSSLGSWNDTYPRDFKNSLPASESFKLPSLLRVAASLFRVITATLI
jgi:hypothetical protein